MTRFCAAMVVSAATLAMSVGGAIAQTQVSLPKIEESHLVVEAFASVEVPADSVVIDFEVATQAPDLETAKNTHLELVGKLSSALEALGLPASSISASKYETARRSRWNDDGTEEFLGYEAECLVEVRTDDLTRGPAIVDTAIASGATQIARLTFQSSQRSEARGRAIAQATEEARRDAKALGAAAGVTLGALRGVYLDPGSYDQQLGIPRAALSKERGTSGYSGQSVFKDSQDRGSRVIFEPQPVRVYATVRLVYETAPIQ